MTSPKNVCIGGYCVCRLASQKQGLSLFFVNFVVSKDRYGHPGIESTPLINLNRYVLPTPPLSP